MYLSCSSPFVNEFVRNCSIALTVTGKNPLKIAFGNGIFACKPMFSYGQRSECADLLNSYVLSNETKNATQPPSQKRKGAVWRKSIKARKFHTRFWNYFFLKESSLTHGRIQDLLLRIRRLSGVTSRSSSVSMKSRACSRLMIFCAEPDFNASSALEERVLVSCFVLQTLSSISSLRSVLTDDHTGVYLLAGSDEESTTLLRIEQTVGDGLHRLEAIREPVFTILNIALVRAVAIE